MLQALLSVARRVLDGWGRSWRRRLAPITWPPVTPFRYCPLERLVLTDGVSRTLFEQYAEHRKSARGEEETGWVLLGLRQERQALALATLPAGMQREAGVAHVRFNSIAQALASRILRQENRQLGIVGVVHTHPGSLRHPSQGDYRGDKEWVSLLRGREGVFGIGTADGIEGTHPLVATQPRRHSQCYLGLRFSWYALGERDRAYRPLPVRLTIGPDLARSLHEIWSIIEAHAERLDRLCRQLAKVRFEVGQDEQGQTLHVVIPRDAGEALRVILREQGVEYWLVRKEQWLVSDSREPKVDRGVYRLLAALAAQDDT